MITRIKYISTTPGGDANTYNLFDSTLTGTQNFLPMSNTARFLLTLVHNQAITLKWYVSPDRGVTWTEIGTEAIAGLAANDVTSRDYLVEGMADWKLDLVNGGVAQTVWNIDMNITTHRMVAV